MAIVATFILFILQPAGAAEKESEQPKPSTVSGTGLKSPFALADQVVLTNQSVFIDGTQVFYDVHAGSITVNGKDETNVADLSFVAYCASSASSDVRSRPIAFCFNGGPGSSSVWLHMGFLGPKTVPISDLNHPQLPIPYRDNPQSLLSVCDLVFIDPVSTGFSRTANPEMAKKFHGVEEDLFSMANFIRSFLTKFQRWESPKLLIGESYGTLRAVGLAHLLQDRFYVDINGLILISLVLDLQCLENSPSQDISCLTALPTLATIAHYHNQLTGPLAHVSVPQLVKIAKEFAIEEYAPALALGTDISKERYDQIAKRVSELTSLPESVIDAQRLRISSDCFFREFLKPQGRLIGRFDGRSTSFRLPDEEGLRLECDLDPSFYNINGSFAAAFHEYIAKDLHWHRDEPYVLLSDGVQPWNWAVRSTPPAGCGYLSFLQECRMAMTRNPTLKLFVAAGYYDLATPFFSQEYSLSHLLLPSDLRDNITLKGYEGGHMMYLDEPARTALFHDLIQFVGLINPSSRSQK
jgi:carboxypeptidase C (cathepsin A)